MLVAAKDTFCYFPQIRLSKDVYGLNENHGQIYELETLVAAVLAEYCSKPFPACSARRF